MLFSRTINLHAYYSNESFEYFLNDYSCDCLTSLFAITSAWSYRHCLVWFIIFWIPLFIAIHRWLMSSCILYDVILDKSPIISMYAIGYTRSQCFFWRSHLWFLSGNAPNDAQSMVSMVIVKFQLVSHKSFIKHWKLLVDQLSDTHTYNFYTDNFWCSISHVFKFWSCCKFESWIKSARLSAKIVLKKVKESQKGNWLTVSFQQW